MKLHKKSTFEKLYDKFSAEFIDSFCAYRNLGISSTDAIIAAKNKIQELLAVELYHHRKSQKDLKIVMQVYNQVKTDSKIVENAIEIFHRMNSPN